MENLTQEQKQFIQNLQGKQRDSYNRARSAGIPPIEALEIVVKSMPTEEVKKESLLKRIVKEPIEALVVRPVARTTEALGRVGVFGENIQRGYEEMADTGQQLDTIVGKYNIA